MQRYHSTDTKGGDITSLYSVEAEIAHKLQHTLLCISIPGRYQTGGIQKTATKIMKGQEAMTYVERLEELKSKYLQLGLVTAKGEYEVAASYNCLKAVNNEC